MSVELEAAPLNNNRNLEAIKTNSYRPSKHKHHITESTDDLQEIANVTKSLEPFEKYINEDCWCNCDCCKCQCCCGKECQFGLTAATFTGALLGILLGTIIQLILKYGYNNANAPDEVIKIIEVAGKLWIRALKLLVLPLIALLMLILPSNVVDMKRIGLRAILFFCLTSSCAAIQGIIWVNIIKPGTHGHESIIPKDNTKTEHVTEIDAILSVFTNAVPANIIVAMSNLQIFGVICFFFTFGLLLRQVNENDAELVITATKGLLKCTMIAVAYVVWATPIGMFSMVASKIVATKDFYGLLKALAMYLVTVLVGHICHVFLVLPSIVKLFTKNVNPYKYFAKVINAPLVAFATSSSAATLPRTLEVAEEADLEKSIYVFMLELGAAINMDGTALGFPIMVMFIGQFYKFDISIAKQIGIMLLSIIVSIGSAPLPNAGMVYMVMLLNYAGMEEYTQEAVATLIVFDWLVDRIETAVNVTSDLYITKIVNEQFTSQPIEKCCCC